MYQRQYLLLLLVDVAPKTIFPVVGLLLVDVPGLVDDVAPKTIFTVVVIG